MRNGLRDILTGAERERALSDRMEEGEETRPTISDGRKVIGGKGKGGKLTPYG